MRDLFRALCFVSLAMFPVSSKAVRPDSVDSSVAQAEVEAEFHRLSDRLEKLVKRNHWAGADRIYRQLRDLGIELSLSQLLIGAQLERKKGDVAASYECLRKIARKEGSREVIDWLVALDQNYGRVRLRFHKTLKAELQIEGALFLPDQQAALSHAQGVLEEAGRFEGFLPVGRYRLGGQNFEVGAGLHVLELALEPVD